MTDEREVAGVLDERPELADALESIRSVDDERATWEFDDVPLDSGTFGELVSQGLVEKTGDGYRLPDATRRALDGEGSTDDGEPTLSLPSLSTVDIDPRSAGALAGALALVFVFRTAFSYGAVFRDGRVVLSGNDPYYYRYWVEQLLADSGGGFDPTLLGELPGAVTSGEPLTVATLWLAASLVGDGASAAGTVLAWYPVVSALVTAALLYLLAVALTDDRRIGLAAIALFATTPAHAMRTSLGFADHHAFDYPWLALAALALVLLARRDEDAVRDPRAWGLGGVLGLAVAGQVLAWENGPALVFPLALFVALVALLDVDAGRSPLRSNAPLLGGFAVAAVLTRAAHSAFGWHTDLVVYSPALLFAGGAAVLLAMEAVHRFGLPVTVGAGVEAVGGFVSLLVVRTGFPTLWADATGRLDRFLDTRNIAETQPLFNGDLMWFLLLGLVLVVALPPLIWASKRAAEGDRPWLAASVYTWYMLLLAALQVRFVGELAVFTALFGGFGFVWLAHWVDITVTPKPLAAIGATPRSDGGPDGPERLRLPTPREAGLVFALFLLVSGVGILQTPVKTSQVTIEGEAYRTAAQIDDHATAANLSYPDNYVLSQWGRNRMFNYFVNGESRSYGYAQSHYETIFTETDGENWYRQHRGRVGYLVTQPVNSNESSLHARLHGDFGSQTGDADGLAHYRAVYVSPSGDYKAFRLVPGATITGTAEPNATDTLSTTVDVPGASFTYERTVRANVNGTYAVTVPYPGEYEVWDQTVTVSEGNVTSGETVNRSK